LKIETFHWLIIIDILTALLLVTIYFVPENWIRVIIGLPFILFFPGYSMLAALFGNRNDMDSLENLVLSVILSIAVVGLIGFGLNYTSTGIKLEPVLYSISVFIGITSTVGLIRLIRAQESRSIHKFQLKWPRDLIKVFSKPVTFILLIVIVISIGVLGYTVLASNNSEKYTEFYILGLYGKAYNYPNEFIMNNNRTVQINYDSGIDSTFGEWGKITLGIVNVQQKKVSYSIAIKIDGEIAKINYFGNLVEELNSIELQPGDRWEREIGFTPSHTGDNQKVEVLLFKDKTAAPEDTLQLWVKVKESSP
jgi:uncharacterized membrane protein